MKVITLVENTVKTEGCGAEHGLSLYIETENHKLLMDTGATDLFIKNAEVLGVDLTQVDTVILSHGHFDHGGGIIPFTEINPRAKIWMQESALGGYYALHGDGSEKYIGLDPKVRELGQLEFAGDICRIDDELTLFSAIGTEWPMPPANDELMKKTEDGLVPDDFAHEQCLVIQEDKQTVLLSGCAHHGIFNILDRYSEIFDVEPDVVISGMHMMRDNGYSDADMQFISETAAALAVMRPVFYTGHCTGSVPYSIMRYTVGDRLQYIRTGDTLMIQGNSSWFPSEDNSMEDLYTTDFEDEDEEAEFWGQI